ncbi:MAG: hypothetical protein QM756_07800 [Polyangiaceae bacterium]
MMLLISLRDFLESGRFGTISLGAGRRALEQAFGEPEAVDADSVRKRRPPAIIKYLDVEFHFDDEGLLWLIHVDRFSDPGHTPQGWGRCQIGPWIIREGLPRAELEREFAVGQYVVESSPELERETVVFASGVSVGFNTGSLEFARLSYLSSSQRNRS